ncbi:50S ribosomal protein L4 [Candidatus Pacearchaeota archaeon]|jgi:large subunit ribosomal protein L4e|nr:50S ribosomal protein L4 [Candidatus Pacearchaeota archaeon]|tara:strand:+ start:9321 stop:10247 length:927 start_codon:yes stop_codon:yes gene_type:complete
MKIQILDKEGKKAKEIETGLFSDVVRIDMIRKVVEAEKIWQPYGSKFRAGMDISASGNISKRRHVWKSDRGKGLSRVPRKVFSRRGTQFNWEAAIIPAARGGRRAHPPKNVVSLKKINQRELKKVLFSALSYVADKDEVAKKYDSVDKISRELPLVVSDNVLKLKSKEFIESLRNILGDLVGVGIQKSSVRSGIGKMRGRRHKVTSGLLLVVGSDEDKKVNGVEVVNTKDLIVSDLASNGARLVMFSEKAVKELEDYKEGKSSGENVKVKKKKESVRKVKSAKMKSKNVKKKANKIKGKESKSGEKGE